LGTNIVIYIVTKKASDPIKKGTRNQGLLIAFDSPYFERTVLKNEGERARQRSTRRLFG
jgi:hypothetical protein